MKVKQLDFYAYDEDVLEAQIHKEHYFRIKCYSSWEKYTCVQQWYITTRIYADKNYTIIADKKKFDTQDEAIKYCQSHYEALILSGVEG